MATATERFWSKVAKSDGCWVWTGAAGRHGYGSAWDGKRNIGAHRRSWELINGSIPEGMYVLHHCDNPPCVRPDHLFLGTQVENTLDAQRKGRRIQADADALKQSAVKILYANGWGMKRIGTLLDLSPGTVWRIIRGRGQWAA